MDFMQLAISTACLKEKNKRGLFFRERERKREKAKDSACLVVLVRFICLLYKQKEREAQKTK